METLAPLLLDTAKGLAWIVVIFAAFFLVGVLIDKTFSSKPKCEHDWRPSAWADWECDKCGKLR